MLVLYCLCPWRSHCASLDLTCIWAAGVMGGQSDAGLDTQGSQGCTEHPSSEAAVVVSVRETGTLAHTFIIRARERQAT